jgi:hypothetical protein
MRKLSLLFAFFLATSPVLAGTATLNYSPSGSSPMRQTTDGSSNNLPNMTIWDSSSGANGMGVDTLGRIETFSTSAAPSGTITRSSNTTTYTANTGWNNGTPTYFTFSSACALNAQNVAITGIDIYSSANPTTKLQGILWLFNAVPGTIISDDSTFTIASGDYAVLTGSSFSGIPFALTNNQASGASNSGVSITYGPGLQAKCGASATSLYGMVQVINAYVPASAEVLTIILHTAGLN